MYKLFSVCGSSLSTISQFALLLFLTAGFLQNAAGQDALLLDADAERAAFTRSQQKHLEAIQKKPTTAGIHVVRLAESASALLEQGKSLSISVSPEREVVVEGKRVEKRGPNDVSWAGSVQEGSGNAVLVLGSEGLAGTLQAGVAGRDLTSYRIAPIGGGLHAVVKLDPSKFPPDHSSNWEEEMRRRTANDTTRGETSSSDSTASPRGRQNQKSALSPKSNGNGPPYNDVLVVYTNDAKSGANSSHGGINSLIQTAIDQTNLSYENSNVNVGVRLAHSAEVGYNEAGRSFSDHLSNLEGKSDGLLDNVHSLRAQHTADAVLLFVDDTDGNEACGLASTIKAVESSAFAVVDYGCAVGTGKYSFSHELGHLQGARHNMQEDPDTSPFKYGHGYIPPDEGWATIMAYEIYCGFCDRVLYWSNPDVSYQGESMGTDTYEDNARVLNQTGYELRDFKTLPTPANFQVSNRYSTGQPPQLTWNSVAGADHYSVYRCVNDLGDSYNPCGSSFNYTLTGSAYSANYTEYAWEIAQSCTANNVSYADYYVTTRSSEGESVRTSKEGVCVRRPGTSTMAKTASAGAAQVQPDEVSLAGNRPNPFSQQTKIQFALPEAAPVSLTVYDIRGQEV